MHSIIDLDAYPSPPDLHLPPPLSSPELSPRTQRYLHREKRQRLEGRFQQERDRQAATVNVTIPTEKQTKMKKRTKTLNRNEHEKLRLANERLRHETTVPAQDKDKDRDPHPQKEKTKNKNMPLSKPKRRRTEEYLELQHANQRQTNPLSSEDLMLSQIAEWAKYIGCADKRKREDADAIVHKAKNTGSPGFARRVSEVVNRVKKEQQQQQQQQRS